MSDRDSFFLVIEGLDGSGKTEISRRLAELMRATLDEHVMLTYEPHDPSAAGLYIRRVLRKKIIVSPHTLALAFALNRADHNERIISPFLEQDGRRVVLCDRYVLSSLVYNTSHDLHMHDVWELNAQARRPDLTLFLDATAEICYARMGSRGGNRDLFETNLAESRTRYFEAIDFLRQHGEQVLVIDANPDLLLVINSIIDAIKANGPRWMTLQKLMFLEATAPAILTPPPLELDRWMRDFIERYPADALAEAASDDGIRRLVAAEVNRLPLDELTALMMNFLQTDRRYRFESAWPGQPIDYTAIRPSGESGGLVILQDERRWEGVVRALESDFIAPHYSIRRDSIQFVIALDPSHAGEEVAQFVPDTGSVPVEVYGRGTLIQYFTRHITRRVLADQTAPPNPEPQLSMELPEEALAEDWSLAAALAAPAVETSEVEFLAAAGEPGELWQAEAEPFAAPEEPPYDEAANRQAEDEPGLRFESDTAAPVEALDLDLNVDQEDLLVSRWEEESAGAAEQTALAGDESYAPQPEAETAVEVEYADESGEPGDWVFEQEPDVEPDEVEYAAPINDAEGWTFEAEAVALPVDASYAPGPESETAVEAEYTDPTGEAGDRVFEQEPTAELDEAVYIAPSNDAEGWTFETEATAAELDEAGYAVPTEPEAWSFEAKAVSVTVDDSYVPAPEAETPVEPGYAAESGEPGDWVFEQEPTAELDEAEYAALVNEASAAAETGTPEYAFAPFDEPEAPTYSDFTPPAVTDGAPLDANETRAVSDSTYDFSFESPVEEHAFQFDAFAALPVAQTVADEYAAPESEPDAEIGEGDAPAAEMRPTNDYDYDPDDELPWRARRSAPRAKTDTAEHKPVTNFSLPPAPEARDAYSFDSFATPEAPNTATENPQAPAGAEFDFDHSNHSAALSTDAFAAPPVPQAEMDEIAALYSGLDEALKSRPDDRAEPPGYDQEAEEEEAG